MRGECEDWLLVVNLDLSNRYLMTFINYPTKETFHFFTRVPNKVLRMKINNIIYWHTSMTLIKNVKNQEIVSFTKKPDAFTLMGWVAVSDVTQNPRKSTQML